MKGKIKNSRLFAFLTVLLIVIGGIFVYFVVAYTKLDKNVYTVEAGSVLYTDSLQYVKTTGNARIEGKLDGNYYLYETIGSETNRYKLGKTAVVSKANDSYLYLYGDAYQILNTGNVTHLSNENKISKSSPTKMFKLDDRKYLMVDSSIVSKDDTVVNTKGYLYVEIDKNGNASFANSELSYKTINPIVLSGAQFNFDIANEELTYDKTIIDLKNVIGSSNQYEQTEDEIIVDSIDPATINNQNNNTNNNNQNKDNSSNNNNSNKSTTKKTTKKTTKPKEETVVELDIGYYDDYLNSIITSVNNLAVSLKNANETSSKLVSQKSVYYDFNKWVALKSVSSKTSSIDISYSVFDPNSEYDVVFVKLRKTTDPEDNVPIVALNKNNTTHSFGDLEPDTEYVLQFGYKTNTSNGEVIDDEVYISTPRIDYDLKVTKISTNNIVGTEDTQMSVYYTLKFDMNYKFQSANVVLKSNGEVLGTDTLSNSSTDNTTTRINSDLIGKDGIYNGVLVLDKNVAFSSSNVENSLSLEETKICKRDSANDCSYVDLGVKYIFYNE